MCNTATSVFQQQKTALGHHQDYKNSIPPPFALSTFHFLRSCNRFILSNSGQIILPESTGLPPSYYNANSTNDNGIPAIPASTNYHTLDTALDSAQNSSTSGEAINVLDEIQEMPTTTKVTSIQQQQQKTVDKSMDLFRNFDNGCTTMTTGKTSLPAFEYIAPAKPGFHLTGFAPMFDINRLPATIFPNFMHRRTRGEKRTIPDELKDEKYFERRKRNNEAAKKSRDARKIREDRNAFRAALLEQENSILRAQVITLRDELNTLKQLVATTSTAATSGALSFMGK